MEDWRGGLAKEGDMSPAILVGRMLGLARGWRDELRRGDPTWPNAEAELLDSSCF